MAPLYDRKTVPGSLKVNNRDYNFSIKLYYTHNSVLPRACEKSKGFTQPHVSQVSQAL